MRHVIYMTITVCFFYVIAVVIFADFAWPMFLYNGEGTDIAERFMALMSALAFALVGYLFADISR